ncbi:MAG: PKD domain-containing protein [Candidatus Binatia bacterium]|nr:PKD domain-containing protein [Candidatus Binatia bacterium]
MRLSNSTILFAATILAFAPALAQAADDSQQSAAPLLVAQNDAGKAQAAAAEPAQAADGAAEPGALTAFADADESSGETPHSVRLDVDVIPGTGHPPFTYIWDFGDATKFSTAKSPVHTYIIPGSFRASVIVTDSKGEIDQDFSDISVDEGEEPGGVTAEQLMRMMPPNEIAPELDGVPGVDAMGRSGK